MSEAGVDCCDGCGGSPELRADVGNGVVRLCAGCRDIVRSILLRAGDMGDAERTTIEIDERVIDSSDLAMLGTGNIGEGVVDLVGEPSDAGFIPTPVRVRGELEVVAEGGGDSR